MLDDIRRMLDAIPFREFELLTASADVWCRVVTPGEIVIPPDAEVVRHTDRDGTLTVVPVRHILALRSFKSR